MKEHQMQRGLTNENALYTFLLRLPIIGPGVSIFDDVPCQTQIKEVEALKELPLRMGLWPSFSSIASSVIRAFSS